jgi:hypothetical protein
MNKKSKEGERRLRIAQLLPSGENYISQGWTTRRFSELKMSNKAATYDSRVVSSQQNSNSMIETYHEG